MSPPILAFKSHLHVTVLDDDEVLLLSEAHAGTILRGRAYTALAPLIDGTRTADEIVSAAPDLSPSLAYYALAMLEKNGHIAPAAAGVPDAAFWHAIGFDPQSSVDALRSATVVIVGDGEASGAVAALRTSLEEIGIRCNAGSTDGATLIVCAVDDYLSPALLARARELDGRVPWMPMKLGGVLAWYGPVFTADGPCLSCLRLRLQENRGGPQATETDVVRVPASLDPLTTEAVASLASVDVARWIVSETRADDPLSSAIVTWDPGVLQRRRHHLVPHHACARCFPSASARATAGKPASRNPREAVPIVIPPTPGRFSIDGGVRSLGADALLETLERYASPITGVLPVLERVACDGLTSTYKIEGAFGKGVADEQGRVSCWMEGIEMRNATFTGAEPSFEARYDELGDRAVHPADLLHVSARQYADRETLNHALHFNHRIPEPIDDELMVSWTPVWSLSRRETRYVPAALCYFRHPQRQYFGRAATNGGAAGATCADAILHAALELVERDAVTLWWYSRARVPALDLSALHEPVVDDILRALAAKGNRVWALDITSDFELPVVVAVRCGADWTLGVGFGAGLFMSESAVRALTELEQIDGLNRQKTRDVGARLHTHGWIEPPNGHARSADHERPASRRDVAGDLQRVVNRFDATGHDLLVLDTSRAGIDVATVRVFSPGIRHWMPRFAPGRLYDTPVSLGWIGTRLTEGQLNDRPFWI